MASETKQHFFILVFFSCLFFVSSLILTLPRPLYNSPDETANAFFAQTFAKHGRLFISEPLNEVLGDVLYPRSIVAFHGRLLPGSFLGLPVFFRIIMLPLPFFIFSITPLCSNSAIIRLILASERGICFLMSFCVVLPPSCFMIFITCSKSPSSVSAGSWPRSRAGNRPCRRSRPGHHLLGP